MYDYLENVKNDVKTAILDNYTKEEIKQKLEYKESREAFEKKLNDALWNDDSVTGNASGSYTFSTYKAEEYLCHNLELLSEALAYFIESERYALSRGAEFCDVTIRCYLLDRVISEVLEELNED